MLACSLVIPANAYAKGCCAWVGVTGGKLDTVGTVGNVSTVGGVGTVTDAHINELQLQQILAGLKAMKAQTDLSTKSMQEMLKFNNTSLIESIKDIKKAEKIAEKMEYVNTVSKDLCDEPDIAASVQNGYKAGSKASSSYGSSTVKNIQNTSETQLEKKVAEIDLREQDVTEANKSTLSEEGMAHQRNKDAIVGQRFAVDYDKLKEQNAEADPAGRQALMARANALTYESGEYATARAEFMKHHAPTIEKTDSIKTLIDNISGGSNKNKEALEEFKEDKLSLVSYAKLRSLQSVLDPEAALERINTNQNSLLGEIKITLDQMLYYQIYMVEMMERMETRMLSIPSIDKTKLDK